MPFKVIQGHRFWYQSKAHMRLPIIVINTNLHHVSHLFEVVTDYCSNLVRKRVTCVVEPLWGLRGNVRCSSYALFAEEVGHVGRQFHVEGDVPTNHLCTVR